MKFSRNQMIGLALVGVAILAAVAWKAAQKPAELPLCPEPDPLAGVTYEEANNLCRMR